MLKLEIMQDDYLESPREWDNLGTCALFHKSYYLPNESPFSRLDFDSGEELEALIYALKPCVCLSVRGYDHDGLAISTSDTGQFSCRWDSGKLGFIYVSKEMVRKEYGVKRISRALREKVRGILIQEIETLDQYLTGDVWQFRITDDDDEILDSCGGFYGYKAAEEEGNRILAYFQAEAEKKAAALHLAMFPPYPFFDRFPVLAVL